MNLIRAPHFPLFFGVEHDFAELSAMLSFRLAHVLDCFLAYVLWKTLDNWKHAYGCGTVTRERIEDAARNANIYEDIGQIPGGFESNLTERGTNLSGCQRQRIAIARIFL